MVSNQISQIPKLAADMANMANRYKDSLAKMARANQMLRERVAKLEQTIEAKMEVNENRLDTFEKHWADSDIINRVEDLEEEIRLINGITISRYNRSDAFCLASTFIKPINSLFFPN